MSRLRCKRMFLWAGPACLLWAGCGSSSNFATGGVDTDGLCSSDAQCDGGYYCSLGACVQGERPDDRPDEIPDGDPGPDVDRSITGCSELQHAYDNGDGTYTCTEPVFCLGDNDCTHGRHCLNGRCSSASFECRRNTECADGFCDLQLLACEADPCGADSECPNPERAHCVGGACVACGSAADCSGAQTCSGNACDNALSCATDADCVAPYVCLNADDPRQDTDCSLEASSCACAERICERDVWEFFATDDGSGEENNDVISRATVQTIYTPVAGTVCETEDDWYHIRAVPLIHAEPTSETPDPVPFPVVDGPQSDLAVGQGVIVQLLYDVATGQADALLTDENGSDLGARQNNYGDLVEIVVDSLPAVDDASSTRPVYLNVFSRGGTAVNYEFMVATFGTLCLNDSFEPNDTPFHATAVCGGGAAGDAGCQPDPQESRFGSVLCRSDSDWYKTTVSPGKTLTVTVNTLRGAPAVAELYLNTSTNLVEKRTSGETTRVLSHQAPEGDPSLYFVRLSSGDGVNSTLIFAVTP